MSSQWLSVEDHHEHDKLYQPIVDRRAQKWQQILAENDGKWPEPSSKCKKVDDVDLSLSSGLAVLQRSSLPPS